MDTTSLLSFAIALLVVILLKTIAERLGSRLKNGPYPPGPKPIPIIGNILDLQIKEPGPEYAEWSKKYQSGICFATAFGNNILIVNTQADADELFEKRAKIYSDRPQIPMTNLIGYEGMVPLMSYGNYWRLCRRICQQHFNYESAKNYRPIIYEKVHNFLSALSESPDNFASHNKMLSVSFAVAIMYGYEVKSVDDPLIDAADRSIFLAGGLLTPDASIINLFPFLAHIPPWLSGPMTSRKIAAEAKGLMKYMQESMMNFAKASIKSGTADASLVTDFLEKQSISEARKGEEQAVQDVAFTTYSGATETTIAVIATFYYLMAKYPEVQSKAQTEIDQVIGSTRLPEFDDRSALPYLEAIYREVMRWSQSLPLGVPHALTEDDYYKGYFIPKGTTVIGNIWAMNHDEDIYPEPFAFKPERFFDESGKLNQNNRILSYGFGRRICVGKAVASSIVWLTMASTLACFNIGKAKDEFGNEIEPNGEYHTEGLVTHKVDYKCSILPRSQIYKDLLQAEKTARV
ncbi:hypothetical protein HYPSUDRAFT_33010 [Hypholoma sublateritium FD-334 SS-4]|uniref:Cytochrome P450 n=1 Tax=Hypholoma sublateritium (strain FD-334 SS-4) TaxID=945553 RepID=A0A0D2LN43_HYPSF|nr:hypothetical protein HYPSUDRAFT_33010 [Hypholoma sublateritium FD-334 SS-4]